MAYFDIRTSMFLFKLFNISIFEALKNQNYIIITLIYLIVTNIYFSLKNVQIFSNIFSFFFIRTNIFFEASKLLKIIVLVSINRNDDTSRF